MGLFKRIEDRLRFPRRKRKLAWQTLRRLARDLPDEGLHALIAWGHEELRRRRVLNPLDPTLAALDEAVSELEQSLPEER